MAIDPTLYQGYIGHNPAHQAFKREIVTAKVILLQLRSSRDHLKEDFERKVDGARKRSPDGRFSLGMVTEVFNQKQFRVLNIPHNEADLVVRDFESLEFQLQALLYMDLQRILESFFLDLYGEIARKDPRVLISNKAVTYAEVLKAGNVVELILQKQLMELSHEDREGIEKAFAGLGLPVLSGKEDEYAFLIGEFSLLWGVRNVLQHNHGIINELFLRKAPDSAFKLGEQVTIDVVRLGRAFAAVEAIADSLNQRALSKFGL
jgi:hypothetical protein